MNLLLPTSFALNVKTRPHQIQMICLFEEPTNWREKWKKSRKEAWEENASNSSSESSEEREANLCLMANEEA